MKELFKVTIKHFAVVDKKQKKFNQSFLFEAVNFSDAELRAATFVEERSLQNANIEAIARVTFSDILQEEEDGLFFEVKVKEEIISEKGKPQKITSKYLLFTENVSRAEEKIHSIYKGTIFKYAIFSVKDSGIFDYITL